GTEVSGRGASPASQTMSVLSRIQAIGSPLSVPKTTSPEGRRSDRTSTASVPPLGLVRTRTFLAPTRSEKSARAPDAAARRRRAPQGTPFAAATTAGEGALPLGAGAAAGAAGAKTGIVTDRLLLPTSAGSCHLNVQCAGEEPFLSGPSSSSSAIVSS